MKLSVRLTKTGVSIAQLLKSSQGLNNVQNWGGINGAELYYGMGYSNPPGWVNFLSAGTNNAISHLISSGAIAILFIPISKRYMTFTFGICYTKLLHYNFERDFGLKVVLNTVDPDKIRSVDSKTIDTVVTNRRTQLSKENKIEDFGFEIDRDLLGAVVGRPANQKFATALGGSDSLTIHCSVTASNLMTKCNEIYKAYTSKVYKTNYAWIDNVKAIKDQPIINILDSKIVTEFNVILNGGANSIFQLASPTIVDFEAIDHYKISGYRSRMQFSLPEFNDVIEDMVDKNIGLITLPNLQHYSVKGVNDAGEEKTEQPFYNWLVAEVIHNNSRYILSEGTWFEISPAYFKTVDDAFQKIINSRQYSKVGQTNEPTEELYLANYNVTSREMILDRQLINTYGGRNRIEACDIYNDFRQFIHVKDGGGSSKLSHLFNQGLVSASAFLGDNKFRTDVKAKLRSNVILANTISSPFVSSDYTVVYRILKKGATFSLPFFTKIVVNDMHRKIKSMGYKFKLEWVEKT